MPEIPWVTDYVGRVAIRIDRSDIFDGLIELLVNESRRDSEMRRQLMLYAQGYFLHPHRIEVGVEVLERWFEPEPAAFRRRGTPAGNRGDPEGSASRRCRG